MASAIIPIVAGLGGILGGIFGSSGGQEIKPQEIKPIWPWMQEPFGDWLFSGFRKTGEEGGVPRYDLAPLQTYPGQLYPDVSQTRLPDVWKSWQPYDAGVSHLLDWFYNNRGGIGQYSPLSQQMMTWGGAGGPGNRAYSLMEQFGTPSMAGLPLNNMALYGYSNIGAGGPMAAFAQGNPGGAASFLAPFLTGQAHNNYQAPSIISRPIFRRA